MSVANGNHLRISTTWKSTISGDQVNVIDVEVGGAGVPVADADVMAGVADWLTSLYDDSAVTSAMPTSTDHYGYEVTNSSLNLVVGTGGPIAALNGVSSDQPLSSGTSALILLRTGIPNVVGRKYLPTFSIAGLVNGRWGSTVQGIMNGFVTVITEPFETAYDFTITARVRSAASGVYHPILSGQGVLVPAYQRRRKEGRGS